MHLNVCNKWSVFCNFLQENKEQLELIAPSGEVKRIILI